MAATPRAWRSSCCNSPTPAVRPARAPAEQPLWADPLRVLCRRHGRTAARSNGRRPGLRHTRAMFREDARDDVLHRPGRGADRADARPRTPERFSHSGICIADIDRCAWISPRRSTSPRPRITTSPTIPRARHRERAGRRETPRADGAQPAGHTIELLKMDAPACFGPRARRPMNEYGLTHLAFYVDDLRRARRRSWRTGGWNTHPHNRDTFGYGFEIMYDPSDGGARGDHEGARLKNSLSRGEREFTSMRPTPPRPAALRRGARPWRRGRSAGRGSCACAPDLTSRLPNMTDGTAPASIMICELVWVGMSSSSDTFMKKVATCCLRATFPFPRRRVLAAIEAEDVVALAGLIARLAALEEQAIGSAAADHRVREDRIGRAEKWQDSGHSASGLSRSSRISASTARPACGAGRTRICRNCRKRHRCRPCSGAGRARDSPPARHRPHASS